MRKITVMCILASALAHAEAKAEDILFPKDPLKAITVPLVGDKEQIRGVLEAMKASTPSQNKYAWELYIDKNKADAIEAEFQKFCPECIIVDPKPKPRPLVPCKKGAVENYTVYDFRASIDETQTLISDLDIQNMEINGKIQTRIHGYQGMKEQAFKMLGEFCPECTGVDPTPLPKPIVLGPCK